MKRRLKRARELARQASELYRRGETARGLEFLTYAARFGDPKARARLERAWRGEQLWSDGSELEDRGDIAGAVKLYRRAAQLGEPSGMLNLANLLDNYTSPTKPLEAIYWYKRGVKANHSAAAFNLAMHYRNLGQRRWYAHWMRVAARMRDPDASKMVRSWDAKLKSKSSRADCQKTKTIRTRKR